MPDGRVKPAAEYDNSDRRPLSAVGGGKDSIVSLEALRRAGLDPVPFSVNPNHVINAVNAASGLPALAARRRIDPVLFELNAAGARNGHIPVTAINSLIAVATAVLHGLGPVVMSNERSASDPNLIWNGHEINHQWSKGVEAEGLLRAALAEHAGLAEPYFSLLRPLSELHIARLFAGIDRYDDVVTSCNAAFKLRDASERWCRGCPKCRFVFLALAPFMPRERITRIFGGDLLADSAQIPGYRELLGIDGHKPFECVGEVEESVVALSLLAQQPDWRDTPVVTALVAAVPEQAWSTAATSDTFTPAAADHHIPPTYQKTLQTLTPTHPTAHPSRATPRLIMKLLSSISTCRNKNFMMTKLAEVREGGGRGRSGGADGVQGQEGYVEGEAGVDRVEVDVEDPADPGQPLVERRAGQVGDGRRRRLVPALLQVGA